MMRAMPKAAKRPKPKRSQATKVVQKPRRKARVRVTPVDPALFAPLTEGERADALRVFLEDERLREMAKVGRYRVISVEAHAMKPPHALANRRLARIVVYDYAGDRCVDGCVELDKHFVCLVAQSSAQPMLSRDEEQDAIEVARRDERVGRALAPGDVPQTVLHYWSRRPTELPYRRRSAAVLFGPAHGARPNAVAVVDLMDSTVVEVLPAERW
jgi:hypothetical protein